MSPGLVIDERTWSAWEAERLKRARADRLATASESPIDVCLYAFAQWKDNAYSCCPEYGRWLADCPACGCHRTIVIGELGDRGAVTIWCRTGCSQQTIADALAAWRAAREGDGESEPAYEDIRYLEDRAQLLEAVADRLCDHIATETAP